MANMHHMHEGIYKRGDEKEERGDFIQEIEEKKIRYPIDLITYF